MIKFVLFIKRVYVLLLFIILEAVALNYYSNSTNFTKAKLLTISNYLVGDIHNKMSDITAYFALRSENTLLAAELVRLRNELEFYRSMELQSDSTIITPPSISPYRWSTATVINNSITRQENFITLNKGLNDSIHSNMAIVSPEGALVGNILSSNDKFSVCISVLNTGFRASGKIKNSDWYGPIYWDGLDHQYVTLTDIPKYATLNQGDTVVTTSYSAIFPPDLLIGIVESYKLNKSMLLDVKVKLSAQLSTISKVFLINYTEATKRTELEQEVTGEYNQ